MNLDSLNFSLSQINNLVIHLNKKNFKQSAQEINQVSNDYEFAALCFLMSPYCDCESENQARQFGNFGELFSRKDHRNCRSLLFNHGTVVWLPVMWISLEPVAMNG